MGNHDPRSFTDGRLAYKRIFTELNPGADRLPTLTERPFTMISALRIILTVTIIGAIVLFASGCLEENFIPDPSDPRLPKYTEDGNQIGGALVNDVAWKTNFETGFNFTNRSFYFTNYSSGDSVTLHMDGIVNEGSIKDKPINFVVVLKNLRLEKLEDIKMLERQSLNLDGNTNYALMDDWHMTINNGVEHYSGGTGAITFTQVKPVIDRTVTGRNGEQYHPLIVAGRFRFHFEQGAIDVTMGRFDFWIDDYYLQQR